MEGIGCGGEGVAGGLAGMDGAAHRVRAGGSAVMAGARGWFIWMTAQAGDFDHAVTDEDVAVSRERGRGEYRAACGGVFVPASMDSAPRPRCPACARFVRARVSMRAIGQRLGAAQDRPRHARAGWWSQLVHRAGTGAAR